MSDLPILMSAPMVQAWLEGRKRETRRLLYGEHKIKGPVERALFPYPPPAQPRDGYHFRPTGWQDVRAGDRLWVRESWAVARHYDGTKASEIGPRITTVVFRAGGSIANTANGWETDAYPRADQPPTWLGRNRHGMFLPRWASRLTLVVEAVRVERLHNITEEGARAEGVEYETADPPFWYVPGMSYETAIGIEELGFLPHAVRSYRRLWNCLHGDNAWDLNPWVVVLRASAHAVNIDQLEEHAT